MGLAPEEEFSYNNGAMSSLLLISAVFVVWAVIHSALADHRVKASFRQRFGDKAYRWYRLGYNVFAALSLLPVLLAYWLLPDRVLWTAPGLWQWVMQGLRLIGLSGLVGAVFHTSVGEFAGVAQLRPHFDLDSAEPLRLSGLYCCVRHPIYFFSLLLIWFAPQVTVNQLTIAALFTLYFYWGARHEETGLRAVYGPAYEAYQQHVPMLFPRPRKCARLQEILHS